MRLLTVTQSYFLFCMRVTNATYCLTQLVEVLSIPVTKASIIHELRRHPHNPSLLAFSDVLNNWGVANAAYKIDREELSDVPTPFIAHLSDRGGQFVLVKHIANNQVTIATEDLPSLTVDLELFNKSWTGNLLVVAPDSTAGEQNYLVKRRKERIDTLRLPLLITCIFLLTILAFHSTQSLLRTELPSLILFFVKSAGLIVSILLLIHSIDASNPLLRRICNTTKDNSCDEILASKAAQITPEISWSEVGFFYFSGTWLLLLFGIGNPTFLQVLAILNLFCLPYTIYSIYYQYKIAKTWCIMCCTIQALLWLEFAIIFSSYKYNLHLIKLIDLEKISLCFISPIILWTFIKPYLLKTQQLNQITEQLNSFRYNIDLFNKIITEQPKYRLLDETDTIIIGEQDADKTITMVTNPFCSPCSRMHQLLEELIAKRSDIRLQVIFITDEDSSSPRNKVVSHLMTLNKQRKSVVTQALQSWYNQRQKDYAEWSQRYPIDNEVTSGQSIQKQRKWCGEVGVTATPTILINGYMLPVLFNVEDIKYFL